jgi:creatinine deaminase
MSNDNKITLHAFTELVAKRAGVSSVEADAYIHQLALTMGEELEKGDYIHLYHFGRFHTTHVGEQMGHNPNSGAPLIIPEHTRVHFRPYRALRFAVNTPFRQLRIKELTEDKTAWRIRTGALILLAVFVVMLLLLGIGVKSRIFTQDASVVPPEKASGNIELVRPVHEAPVTAAPEPATVTIAPAEAQTIPAPTIVATVPVEPALPTAKATATVVTVSSGDTLWAIAATTWGDPFWWPVIYAENRPELSRLNPDLIDIGITLRIPALAGSVNSPKAADLQLKENAYRIVADDYQKLDNPRAAEYAAVAVRGFNTENNKYGGLAEGGIPIGSVLVIDDKIVGRGHNRRVQKGSAVLHAEMDCLENAGRLTAADYRRATLYSTLSPCDMCSGAVLLYGIPKLVIGENKTFRGPEEYVKSRGVEVVVANNATCCQLMETFIQKSPELWNEDIGV